MCQCRNRAVVEHLAQAIHLNQLSNADIVDWTNFVDQDRAGTDNALHVADE